MMVPVAIELEKSVSRASKTEELICKSTSLSLSLSLSQEKEEEIKKHFFDKCLMHMIPCI